MNFLTNKAVRLLSFPTVIWIAVALSVVLHLPGLGIGFRADDYLIQAVFDGQALGDSVPHNAWRYSKGTAESVERLIENGTLPWWSHAYA